MEKALMGKEVAKGVLQNNWIQFLTVKLPKILGLIAFIISIIFGNMFKKYSCVDWSSYSHRCLDYESSFGWGAFFASLLIFGIIIFVYYIIAKIYKKQELIVTEKGVTGKLKVFFNLMEVTIPIDQVSTIAIAKGLFNSKFMIIASASGRYHISFIDNPEEIRNAILKIR